MAQNRIPVTVVGNLTQDPELKFTPSGIAVANFTIAVNEQVYENGQWVDGETTFIPCDVWKQLAEHFCGTAHKGMRVIATGQMRQKNWTTQEGHRRSQLVLNVTEVGPSCLFTAFNKNLGTQTTSPQQTGWNQPTSRPQTGYDDQPPF